MHKIRTIRLFFTKIFPLSLFILSTGLLCFAQDKIDLEVSVQTASNTVYGGENLLYSVTVHNLGKSKATEVSLTQFTKKKIISAIPTAGSCRQIEIENRSDLPFECELGDIEPNQSVIINFEINIEDFGGQNETDNSDARKRQIDSTKKLIESIQNMSGNTEIKSVGTSIAKFIVSADNQQEDNKENNRTELFATLLPSKNLPPKVEIITPKQEEIIIRNSKKLTKVVFIIKAFDLDGEIKKVVVSPQQFKISIEYPENKIVVDGKKYSVKEIEENKELYQKVYGYEAVKTGKDTYTFTLENPQYGLNNVFVSAFDNGNRKATDSVRLMVQGDNSIEFTTPGKDSLINPNTDLTIEAAIKLNDGIPTEVLLFGFGGCCEKYQMKQISRNGNSYIFHYILKNITKGDYAPRILLTEDSGAFTYSQHLEFKVTEKPQIRINSPKTKQVFNHHQKIPLEVESFDSDGTIERVIIYIDGEIERDFFWDKENKNGTIPYLRKGTHKIYAKAVDDMNVGTDSEPIIIIVQ